jgi:HEAT repeat protein
MLKEGNWGCSRLGSEVFAVKGALWWPKNVLKAPLTIVSVLNSPTISPPRTECDRRQCDDLRGKMAVISNRKKSAGGRTRKSGQIAMSNVRRASIVLLVISPLCFVANGLQSQTAPTSAKMADERSEVMLRQLLSRMNTADASTRLDAVQGLASYVARSPEALAALQLAITDADTRVRLTAIRALEKAGHQSGKGLVRSLARCLQDRDLSIQDAAADALRALAIESPEAVSALARGLNENEPEVRRECAEALWIIGPSAKEAMPTLLAALRDRDESVQWYAVEALGRIGLPALPDLVKLLKGSDVRLKRDAAAAIARIGPDARSAVRALIDALEFGDVELAIYAADALGAIGPHAVGGVTALAKLFLREDRRVQAAGGSALAKIGAAAVPELVGALRHGDDSLRRAAALALGRVDFEPMSSRWRDSSDGNNRVEPPVSELSTKIELALVEAMRDKNEEVRRAAAAGAWKIRPESRPAIPALIETLRGSDPGLSRAAAETLGRLGQTARGAVPALAEALRETSDLRLRREIVHTLYLIGPAAEGAADSLIAASTDADVEVRRRVAYALGAIHSAAQGPVSALVALTHDRDLDARTYAVEALAHMAAASEAAMVGLMRALEDDNLKVRTAAARALDDAGIGVPEVVGVLRRLLNGRDKLVSEDEIDFQRCAAEVLANCGSEARSAVPELRPLLKDHHPLVENAAAIALGKIGAEARDAVVDLIGLMRGQSDSQLRRTAMEALGNIGPNAEAAVPDLVEALTDTDTDLHGVASEALRKIGKASVPALTAALAGSDQRLQVAAAEILGAIGVDGSHAVSALVLALRDPKEGVSVAAANALAKVVRGLDYSKETKYLAELEAALSILPELRDRMSPVDLDVVVASVTQTRNALQREMWFWRAVYFGVGIVVLAAAVPLVYFRTSAVYLLRMRFGARWSVDFDPTAWEMRIGTSDEDSLLVQVTPGASAVATFQRKMPYTAEVLNALRASRLYNSDEYVSLLQRTLGWDIGLEQMLGQENCSIAIIADVDWQAEHLEALRINGKALGLAVPVCRLVPTQQPVAPPLTGSFELRGLVIGDPEMDLRWAAREAELIHKIFSLAGISSTLLRGERATLAEISRTLSEPGHWLLHFAGHVRLSNSYAGWEVGLHGGSVEVTKFVKAVSGGQSTVLAFMNGCGSVGDVNEGSAAPGLGALFLQQGIPFVGTQLSVYDGTAMKFAVAFYNAFLPDRNSNRGEALGNAVLAARRKQRSSTWYNYIAFGRPGYHLRFGVPR